MKKTLFTMFSLSALVAVSCQKDPDVQRVEPQKLLGKWLLERAVEETYSPATTLTDREEYLGEPGDSIVFRPNNVLYSYDGPYMEETEYRLLDNNRLRIEQEEWTIEALNEQELTLVQDETEMNERYVIRLFLVR
ncbi:MAG TPA: hypothetical protein VGE66_04390 [Chitinophagaceae bacterium]